jgi:hypothetical protein
MVNSDSLKHTINILKTHFYQKAREIWTKLDKVHWTNPVLRPSHRDNIFLTKRKKIFRNLEENA